MLSIKVSEVVTAIVRQLFDKNDADESKRAVHFHFDCMLLSTTKGGSRIRQYHASRGLHLLYHRYMSYGTTLSVFSAVTDSHFCTVNEIKTWKHETTHDSVWRDISAFSASYFAMAKEINAARKRDRLKEIAPADMEGHTVPYLFMGGLYEWLPVKVELDPADTYRHKRLITIG